MNLLSRVTCILKLWRKNSSSPDGKILLELVLAGPILLTIPAAVIEYARFMRFNQEAIVLSQEAANQIYRQCSDFYEVTQERVGTTFNTVNTKDTTNRCVKRIHDELETVVRNRLGNAGLILSVFRYNISNAPSTPPPNAPPNAPTHTDLELIAVFPSPTGNQASLNETKIVSSPLMIEVNVNNGVLPAKRLLVPNSKVTNFKRFAIAEVSFNYQPMIGLFRVFFNQNIFEREGGFREITVL